MTLLTRTRRTRLAAAAAALTLAATLSPAAPALAGPASSPAADRAAQPARTVDVMTRNLYLGADLFPVIGALTGQPGSPPLPVAAANVWSAVQGTNPPLRMQAIADEIATENPAVIGLQEVTTWTTYPTFPVVPGVTPGTVQYDFLELLLDALQDRGLDYREVEGATSHNFASPPIPLFVGSTTEFAAITLADRDVILARGDVTTSDPRNGNFDRKVVFSTAFGPLPVERGWGSVDVRSGLARFRFVNSHLEAFDILGGDPETIREAQAAELLEEQADITVDVGELPMVFVGDYNSRAPDGDAYQVLLEGTGQDAWTVAGGPSPGFTCCFDALVANPDRELTTRIDLVLAGDRVKPRWADVIGEDPGTDFLTGAGLWPSDHAGVVARLWIPPTR